MHLMEYYLNRHLQNTSSKWLIYTHYWYSYIFCNVALMHRCSVQRARLHNVSIHLVDVELWTKVVEPAGKMGSFQ